jgi:hypothetical protein
MKALYLFCLFVCAPYFVTAQSVYKPPPNSAELLKNVPWASARRVGDNFRKIYLGCDNCKKGNNYPCPNIKKPGKVLKNGCSGDPNRNTTLLMFSDGTIFFDGKMALDADGSAYAKAREGDGVNQSQTSFQINGKSLDAAKVPFIVVPQDYSATVRFKKTLGVRVGDIAAIVYKNTVVYAIVGDEGPSCRLGEGSIDLHVRLGHNICKNADCSDIHDLGIDNGVQYFIFPNSDIRKITGLTFENLNQHIEEQGNKLFHQLK